MLQNHIVQTETFKEVLKGTGVEPGKINKETQQQNFIRMIMIAYSNI